MFPERRSWHFGVLPFTGTGHLNPLIDLGLELTRRGHRVTFFERPKIRERVENAGLGFVPVCGDRSMRTAKPTETRSGLRAELAMLRFNLQRVTDDVAHYLRETPASVQRAGVDALLINEIALTGPTLAQMLGLPYVILSTTVPLNCGWNAHSLHSGYRLKQSPFSILERALLEISAVRVRGPIRRVLDRYRRSSGLEPVSDMLSSYPPLAQITQLPACLELPEVRLPANCHHTGPFIGRGVRPFVDFPWERLDGRPIVYVTLGTTRNAQDRVLRLVAEACSGLDIQLVISLGKRFAEEQFEELPGEPVVVPFAPQLELMKRVSLVITHAGFNTAFEALMEGKPMVAIPLAHDQPAIAARLAHVGAAHVLPVRRLSTKCIRAAVLTVMTDPAYRYAAVALQKQIRETRGSERAAEIIEEAMRQHIDSRKATSAACLHHLRLIGSG